MTLKEKINNDVVAAMKANDALRVSVLRLLKSAIGKFEVAGKEKIVAVDENVLTIIGKEVKQRRDSIEAYRKAGREDLAVKEEAEMKILQTYLPAQMNEKELRSLISQVINQLGATSKTDLGKVMGGVMAQVKGKADGQIVNRLVGEMLK